MVGFSGRPVLSLAPVGLKLLKAKGGFQFGAICLCLMSLAIGLVFHRSLYPTFLLPSELASLVHEDAGKALTDFDEAVILVLSGAPGEGVVSSALQDIGSRASRMAELIRAAIEGLPDEGSHEMPGDNGNLALVQIEALLDLLLELENEGIVHGDTSHSLETTLLLTRTAFMAFLEELATVDRDVETRRSYGLAVLTAWFWAFLVLGTVAGILFLRVLREEIIQRTALDRAERKADFFAYFDPATRLGNRFQFQDKLSSGITSHKPLSVMLFDIDSFRKFNVRFGRLSGDIVLKEIAYRLERLAEEVGGFAARLSSDNFAMLVPVHDELTLKCIAQKAGQSCRRPIVQTGQTHTVSVSIGCARLAATDTNESASVERTLMKAGLALEFARNEGGNQVAVYRPELERKFTDREAMAERLPQAIADRDVQVHFRPRKDLRTDRIIGFEAVAMWHRDGCFVAAPEIRRAADQGGVVGDLDRFVLQESIRLTADWNRRHRTAFSVSVNVLIPYLHDDPLDDEIVEYLDRYGLSPAQLTLGIIDNVQIGSLCDSSTALSKIRALGCRVSTDVCGAGFSSFRYLRRTGVDEIKIDHLFVEGIEESQQARALLKSVMKLPASLGCAVALEGVTTSEQEEIVRGLATKRVNVTLLGETRPALEWLAEATYVARPLEVHPIEAPLQPAATP